MTSTATTQHIVNCNGSCFLCLTNCQKSNSPLTRKTEALTVYPLQYLCSFLPLELDSIWKFPSGVGVELFVPLCGPCGGLINQFNQLHQQLDNCLAEVYEVLEKSMRAAAATIPGKSYPEESDGQIMEKLRTQAIGKCTKKLPWLLSRQDQRSPDELQVNSVSNSVQPPLAPPPPPPPTESEAEPAPTPSVPGSSASIAPEPTSQTSIYSRDYNNPRCPYCYSSSFQMKLHYAYAHPEHFFQDIRDPSVSPEEFKEIVATRLFHDVLKVGGGQCILCLYQSPNKKEYLRRRQLKVHLIATHLPRLQKTVADLQMHRGSTLQVNVLPLGSQLPEIPDASSHPQQEEHQYCSEEASGSSNLLIPDETEVCTSALVSLDDDSNTKRIKLDTTDIE